MSLRIKFSKFSNLFDGKILPKSNDTELKNVIFYNLVIRQGDSDIIRIPFIFSTGELEIFLFKEFVKIPLEFIGSRNAARFNNNNDDIHFHVYKFREFVKDNEIVIGLGRLIAEYSSDQDQKFHSIQMKNIASSTNFMACSWTPDIKKDVFEPIETLLLYTSGNFLTNPVWNTQRKYYKYLRTNMNMELQRSNYENLMRFFKKHKQTAFKNIINFLTVWGTEMEPCAYEPDKSWTDSASFADEGDRAIESTKSGDCEDFAHYYIRMLHQMAGIYQFIVTKVDSDLYKYCKMLAINYIPFVYICKIQQRSQPEYHCTMLIIPTQANIEFTKVISFEVTNNKNHVLVLNDNSDFFKWHKEHYFLLDSYHLMRMNDNALKIANYNIKELVNGKKQIDYKPMDYFTNY